MKGGEHLEPALAHAPRAAAGVSPRDSHRERLHSVSTKEAEA
jgi:hypothetical protein